MLDYVRFLEAASGAGRSARVVLDGLLLMMMGLPLIQQQVAVWLELIILAEMFADMCVLITMMIIICYHNGRRSGTGGCFWQCLLGGWWWLLMGTDHIYYAVRQMIVLFLFLSCAVIIVTDMFRTEQWLTATGNGFRLNRLVVMEWRELSPSLLLVPPRFVILSKPPVVHLVWEAKKAYIVINQWLANKCFINT